MGTYQFGFLVIWEPTGPVKSIGRTKLEEKYYMNIKHAHRYRFEHKAIEENEDKNYKYT